VRTLLKQDFDHAFEQFAVLIGPTSPTVAFKLGEKLEDPYAMYLNDVFTIPINLAGITGLSIPGGFSEGLPVGVQLIGPSLGEPTLLRVADAFERVTDYHTAWPDLRSADRRSANRRAGRKRG
jgi:aspartyl-tRNA(Asn)/glutamyl-tRNA(Gln) amidotransferase subunit A